MFPSSTKREIRQFHAVVVQRRQRNVQKSVMHVQSCFFACLSLLLVCRSRCRGRGRCVNSLLLEAGGGLILEDWGLMTCNEIKMGWREGREVKVARLDFLGGMPPKFEH